MSEVIARPAKAKSNASKTASKAAAPAQEEKFTRFTIKAAFGILEVLLVSASKTDEAHSWSGDSNRLLRIAAGLAGEAHEITPNYNDAERVAFDIAALIKAAKLVPGDTESAERADLINQAAVQLNWLTECDEAGSNCIEVGAARPAVQPQVSTPFPSTSEGNVAATGVSLLGQATNSEGWDYPARGLANAAVCHLEAAVEVLRLIADCGSSDEIEGLRLLLEMVWSKHQSTDEAEDIGEPHMGAFADLQRELSVAYAMAQLVRLREEGAASGVSLLLQRASELAEDALHAIPKEAEGAA